MKTSLPKMINLGKKKEVEIIPLKVKLPFIEKLTIIESLGIMLSAGIPITEALESIKQDSTAPNTKGVVSAIVESIQKGNTLADSFSQFPNIYDEILINTVRAGEESGNLDKVLGQLTESLRQEEQLKSDVKSAMFYPALVLGVLFVVLVVLLGFVVPRVAEIFDKINIPKPLPTRILLSSATFISEYYLLVISFGVIVVIGVIILFSKRKVRRKIMTLSFSLPIIGSILKLIDLARLTSTLSLLLTAGIPIIKAVETSSKVLISDKTKQELENIQHKLTEGKGLAESMREYKTFPTFMTRIISTGEKSGNLDEVLGTVATNYSKNLNRKVKQLSTALEPILLIIVGVIVGSVIISIIAPIYQLIGQISPQ